MGLDSQKALAEHDETCNMQNRIRIQIMELNPICEEKASKKRVRGTQKSSEDEGEKDYPEAWGSRWMISGPAMRDSAGSFLRMLIFLAFDSSLSPILVWTQLPTTEVSVSAVLALLAVAPVAALATVEPLLPMVVELNRNFGGMEDEREASLEQNARKKMTAAEWGEQLPLCCYFYLVLRNCRSIQLPIAKGKRLGKSGRPCVSTAGAAASTTHGN
jgi:hypothetical protein